MKHLILLFLVIYSFSAKSQDSTKQQLIKADKNFSNLSEKDGSIKAFLAFAAPNVVILKDNMLPIKGLSALQEYYKSKSDTSYTLVWGPQFAKLSNSGELGYTYGYWYLTGKTNKASLGEGSYITIWEKQPDGSWKFVLDTGTSGLGQK